jgi:hypothetical protein
MKIETLPPTGAPSDEEYEYLGWYQPDEAYKLLKRFDDAGVKAQIEQSTGNSNASAVWAEVGRGFGIASQILISIHQSCREEAHRIHRELFGDCAPTEVPPEASGGGDGEGQ